MSQDFRMECIRIINSSKFELMKSTEEHGYYFIGDLFLNSQNQDIRKYFHGNIPIDIFKDLPEYENVSFDWFDNLSYTTDIKYNQAEIIRKAYDPKIIYKCVDKVWQTILSYNDKLPVMYHVSERNDFQLLGSSRLTDIFIDGNPYRIVCNYNQCSAIPFKSDKRFIWNGISEIDLRSQTSITCHRMIGNMNKDGESESQPGQKIIAYVLKESYRLRFESILQDFISLCQYAVNNNYLIITIRNG